MDETENEGQTVNDDSVEVAGVPNINEKNAAFEQTQNAESENQEQFEDFTPAAKKSDELKSEIPTPDKLSDVAEAELPDEEAADFEEEGEGRLDHEVFEDIMASREGSQLEDHDLDHEEELLDDFPKFEGIEYEEEIFGEMDEEMSEYASSEGVSVPGSRRSSTEQSISLQQKFDREKLLEAIHEVYALRQKEERKNFLLNKKVVEYFRRKKSSRALHEDNADNVYELIKKYRNLLLKLDQLKGQEEGLKNESEKKLNELREEYEQLTAKTNAGINDLNKLLREVGVTCQSTKTGLMLSEKIVEKYIRKMTLLRDQISEVRLELLKTQDKISAILMRTKQLEDLGDGLKVINFEQLRAETQSLSDKIEERNNELTKLRRRCNSDIHILAHVREKQFMLSNTILVQEGVLHDLQNEENSCRNYLNYIKLERDELRKKLKEMSFDCGLLDKPALLRDYDRTVEKIRKTKFDIDRLKAEKEKIVDELKGATLRVESRLAIKTDMQKFDDALYGELANLDKSPYPRILQGIKPVRNIDLSRYRMDWKN